MNKIISIQLEYIFNSFWSAAVHRNGSTKIYHKMTKSSWDRIHKIGHGKLAAGNLSGGRFNFVFR